MLQTHFLSASYPVTIQRSNLATALALAIESARASEKARGYSTSSAFLAGLEQVAEALREGREVEVVG